MFEAKAIIRNKAGIHCRPSAVLVEAGMGYPGTIEVIAPNGSCNLKSALELIMLGLEEGTEVTIRVSGPDEETFGRKLVELFEKHFDFPPRE